jgi:hypothetical protein
MDMHSETSNSLLMAKTASKIVVKRNRKPKPQLYVGAWLRRLDLQQRAVAKDADIGESFLSSIIKGERYPSATTIMALAKAMEIPAEKLLEPPPPADAVRAAAGLNPEVLARLSRRN